MILHGNNIDVLKTLPEGSVQCVVTSPPYWALRKYDIPDVVFDGDPACEHAWTEERAPWANGQPGPQGAVKNRVADQQIVGKTAGSFCRCGAWRGQLGQEPSPDLFVSHLVDVFREVRRVLRADGTCFVNMGDCYFNGDGSGCQPSRVKAEDLMQRHNLASDFRGAPNRRPVQGLKNKDLVGVPWMLAFALRGDGWWLRVENVWAKGISFCSSYAGSVMPESIKDRPTRSHEQVFMLTKSERYFYDHEAVKEVGVYPAGTLAAKGSGTREGNRRGTKKPPKNSVSDPRDNSRRLVERTRSAREAGAPHDVGVGHHKMAQREDGNHPWDGYAEYDGKRNLRTVWAIGVEPFHEAHFATFPPDLVDPCFRAGTSQKGACANCGAPWKRVVEYDPLPDDIKAEFEAAREQTAADHGRDDGFTTRRPNFTRKRLGEHWEPTCECTRTVDGESFPYDLVPCIVMDPFAGSGSAGVAAERLQLKFIGIDLGAAYTAMAKRRIADVAPLFSETA